MGQPFDDRHDDGGSNSQTEWRDEQVPGSRDPGQGIATGDQPYDNR